jgi:hypothetical protein
MYHGANVLLDPAQPDR